MAIDPEKLRMLKKKNETESDEEGGIQHENSPSIQLEGDPYQQRKRMRMRKLLDYLAEEARKANATE